MSRFARWSADARRKYETTTKYPRDANRVGKARSGACPHSDAAHHYVPVILLPLKAHPLDSFVLDCEHQPHRCDVAVFRVIDIVSSPHHRRTRVEELFSRTQPSYRRPLKERTEYIAHKTTSRAITLIISIGRIDVEDGERPMVKKGEWM